MIMVMILILISANLAEMTRETIARGGMGYPYDPGSLASLAPLPFDDAE